MSYSDPDWLARVRSDIPLLDRQVDGTPLIYLDSAATALKPLPVVDIERRYSIEYTSNIHRGKHLLSEEASEQYESARREVARFIGAAPDCVVFTRNATDGINVLASGLGLLKTDRVMLSFTEHHSNIVPWMRAAEVVWMEREPCASLDPEDVGRQMRTKQPRLLAIGHASNVTGVVEPIARICEIARELGVLTVVDAAQSAPHMPIDVEQLGCDALVFSGHKLMGPTGIGVLWARSQLLARLEPSSVGGGTIERVTRDGFELKRGPFRFEAGTPHIAGAIGLAAALSYLQEIGFERIVTHEEGLANTLEQEAEDIPGMRVLMSRGSRRLALAQLVPTSAFIKPESLALMLSDGYKVMVRSGFHCAHPFFDAVGVPGGALRVSAYLYNSVDEIRACGRALREILGRFLSSR